MSVLLIFVDGVGIGRRDPSVNPFAVLDARSPTLLGRYVDELQDHSPSLRAPYSGLFRAVDATLGVEGLPQSATGQAAILTGVNVPAAVGAHRSGVPGPQVRAIIEEGSLFATLARSGRRATFANAYTSGFFSARRPRLSATTLAVRAAGLPFRTLDDLREGRAVFHDYTLGTLRDRTGITLPPRSAAEAADTLAGLSREHDFVMHEHFLTDIAGHRGTGEERLAAATRIEALIEETVRALAGSDTLLLVISDHGNLEDSTTHRHTLAPVPFLAWGPGAEEMLVAVPRLDALAPAILRRLGAA